MDERIVHLLEEQNSILKRQEEFNNKFMKKIDDAMVMLALIAAMTDGSPFVSEKNCNLIEQYTRQKFGTSIDL